MVMFRMCASQEYVEAAGHAKQSATGSLGLHFTIQVPLQVAPFVYRISPLL